MTEIQFPPIVMRRSPSGWLCSVPGCGREPDPVGVRVKATPATTIEQDGRTVALTHLCDTHRAEFEKLGWLAPREDDDERGA